MARHRELTLNPTNYDESNVVSLVLTLNEYSRFIIQRRLGPKSVVPALDFLTDRPDKCIAYPDSTGNRVVGLLLAAGVKFQETLFDGTYYRGWYDRGITFMGTSLQIPSQTHRYKGNVLMPPDPRCTDTRHFINPVFLPRRLAV